jgi:heat shock 70kDa protein 1/2/6/8
MCVWEPEEAEDDAVKKKVDDKNALESYAYNMRNTLRDDKVASQLSDDDTAEVKEAINNTHRHGLTSWPR